jgi:mannose-6-phosphate isomerase
MLYPLKFHPIFKERVWGGRQLEELYHKPLPPGARVGESWEVSDRPGDASVIANGPLAGKDLRWLMENHTGELLGPVHKEQRFPLLIKILDAQEKLSLQVHPPAAVARQLGGEPKTEMWYIAAARPGAELYAGLKRGVTRGQFEQRIRDGSVAECFHRLPVQAGDALFLPSGRVHAIGDGLVIFEIQQNSDTTYRVFDWNRVGLDGKPRELHVKQSLASIDFEDFEPACASREQASAGTLKRRTLANDPLFRVEAWTTYAAGSMRCPGGKMRLFGVVEGRAVIVDPVSSVAAEVRRGEFCLVPAAVRSYEAKYDSVTTFLDITSGEKDSV